MRFPCPECAVLLEPRHNFCNGVRRIILQEDVDMIFVCLNPTDIPMLFATRVTYILLYIVLECAFKQWLPVFGHKYQVDHQQVLVMSSVLVVIVFVLHLLIT